MSSTQLAPSTALADEVVARHTSAFEPAANPERVAFTSSYMKGHFSFLGITSAPRRALAREALAGLPSPDEADVAAVAATAWALDAREYQYAAAVRRFVAGHDAELSGLSKREAPKWLEHRAARGEAA